MLYKNKLDTIRHEVRQRAEEQQTTKTKKKPTAVRQVLETTKKEHRTLIEQNRSLKEKSGRRDLARLSLFTSPLEQLEHDLHGIIEENRHGYEKIDREHRQLQSEIPELDALIVHLRENAVSLWSEINTYRYLLVNLLSTKTEEAPVISRPKVKKPPPPLPPPPIKCKGKPAGKQYRDETTGFIVHIEDGIIWVRI